MLDAAHRFVETAENDPDLLGEIEKLKGTRQAVLTKVVELAAARGFEFSQDEWDEALRKHIFAKVSSNEVTLEQYRRAANYIAGTGSVICCCSHWSH